MTRLSLARAATVALLLLALVLVGPYVVGPIYRFPDPAPFRGTQLFNPYHQPMATWQRANFHAHGRAWVGLTNGQQSDREVAARYRSLGYDIAGVSNYQRIAAPDVSPLPIYEHGYNLRKTHQLAIGAHRVAWLDFVLWQSLSHQQFVIDQVKQGAELVAVVHPATLHNDDNLARLGGYDLLEVVNGPHPTEALWDIALSSGHAVWAIGDDDTHDLNDASRTAAGWTMVGAPTASPADVIDALRAGRTYAVFRKGDPAAADSTTLDAIVVEGDLVRVTLKGAPATITFVGQNGVHREARPLVTALDYRFTAADPYIRVVIESPHAMLFLNPIVRWDGVSLPHPRPLVDRAATWTLRLGIGLGLGAVAWLYTRRRRASLPSTARPVMASTERRPA